MDVGEILSKAIRIEEEGIEYYSKSAERITDENGKQTLLFLVEEERRHKNFFESMLSSKGKDPGALKDLVVPRIFPEHHDYTKNENTSVDQEILKRAMGNEKRSIEFYESSLNTAEEEELRSGLQTIIKEEEQHLEWIVYLLESISTHGYWSGLDEHFSLDGG